MFPFPIYLIINSNFVNFLRKFIQDRDSKPLPAINSLYPVSVLVFIFFILDIIKKYKYIRLVYLVKITEPWYELGLMYRCYHKQKSFSHRLTQTNIRIVSWFHC